MRTFDLYFPSDGPSFSRILAWRSVDTVNRILWIVCGGRTRQTSPYSLCAECAAGSLRASSAGSVRSATGGAWSRRGEQSRRESLTSWAHVDEMDDKHKTHDLSHGECAWCDTVLTNEKIQDNAHSHSSVRVDVHNVEVSDNGHVVIGVLIVQCYHAIMSNSEFSVLVSIIHLLSGCMNWSSLFPVAIYCTLSHRENMSVEVLCLHPPVGYSRPLSAVNDPSVTK